MGEGLRKALAFTGCGLWLGSSLMPLFGGAAKHRVLCRGATFDGQFDACFNDYLPVLELIAPLGALFLLYPFAVFASAVWAPEPGQRRQHWRLAPETGAAARFPWYTLLCTAGLVGAAWLASRYPLDPVTAPFMLFWTVFGLWFAGGATVTFQAGRARLGG
ncbi:hypothetical protein GR702_14780 [Novosphingobium sp. FGD1]|jgi:hypothetical protein|uniref:Uncharacterized protein n=1 Tax=Novosphingobium silvae TaxID=2692619 RepID=A0A7X4GI15_9SPHN|nr:hypothetical protein [Novosphingobium silvae]MYL99030.1 hypothetical protein [Novosphingobium silvae]